MKILLLVSLWLTGAAHATDNVTLTTYNTVVFRGVVLDDSVMDAQNQLHDLNIKRGAKKYPIYLVLDSPGGSVSAGFSLIEFAKTIRNLKTISIFAASMASGIAEALPGERLVTETSTMMFHRASGSFAGYFETGEVESRLFMGKTMVLHLETINSNRMGMALDVYKQQVQNELWLFGGTNLVTVYKSADRIVTLSCTDQLIKQSTTLTLRAGIFGAIDLEFSGCPLFRSPRDVSAGNGDVSYVVPSIQNYKSIDLIRAQ